MPRPVVISTGSVNCYGSRIITAGIDISQYQRNPVLLYMHKRGFDGTTPIGRIDDLHIEGDRLIGTPVFDMEDEFAAAIANKWEKGFLRMASAGIDIVETSKDAALLMEGQTRETITRSKLVEVSIVDIGANDDSLQLYADGKLLTLAKGTPNEHLQLLSNPSEPQPDTKPINTKMNKEMLTLLGLAEDATEQQQLDALKLMKSKADRVAEMENNAINAIVDQAVKEHRIAEGQRSHFANMGAKIGAEDLKKTLNLMQPARRPSDAIDQAEPTPAEGVKTYAKLSEVPAGEVEALRRDNRAEYVKLFKAEYGFEPVINE